MVKSIGLTINSPYSVSVDAASKSHHHFRQWWLYGGHLGPQQTPRRWSSTIILIRGLWFYDPTASIYLSLFAYLSQLQPPKESKYARIRYFRRCANPHTRGTNLIQISILVRKTREERKRLALGPKQLQCGILCARPRTGSREDLELMQTTLPLS